jgi:hypothetical protein
MLVTVTYLNRRRKWMISSCKQTCRLLLLVRFQVLTAASMKITVLWDVASWSLVEVYQRFRGACCFHHQDDRPSHILPDYKAQHPTRQSSSCTVIGSFDSWSPWEALTFAGTRHERWARRSVSWRALLRMRRLCARQYVCKRQLCSAGIYFLDFTHHPYVS